MSIRYIGIDPTFPHHLNSFDNVPVNYTYGPLVNVSVSNPAQTYFVNVINYTLQAQSRGFTYTTFSNPLSNCVILLFMTALDVNSVGDLVSADM